MRIKSIASGFVGSIGGLYAGTYVSRDMWEYLYNNFFFKGISEDPLGMDIGFDATIASGILLVGGSLGAAYGAAKLTDYLVDKYNDYKTSRQMKKSIITKL